MDFCWTFAHSDIGRAPGRAKAKMDEVFKVAATDSCTNASRFAPSLAKFSPSLANQSHMKGGYRTFNEPVNKTHIKMTLF